MKDNPVSQSTRPDPLAEAAKELLDSGLLSARERRIIAGYADPNRRRDPQPVGCDLCGWKGRRVKARPRPCPNCGSGKVQFR